MTNFLTKTVEENHATMLVEMISALGASTDPALWVRLVHEEAQEAYDALRNEGVEQQLKELSDLRYVLVGFTITRSPFYSAIQTEASVEMMAAAADLVEEISVILAERQGTSSDLSDENLEVALQRVHDSNMSKLGDDGKPILREDGKVLKGPNYKAPDLSDLVKVAA